MIRRMYLLLFCLLLAPFAINGQILKEIPLELDKTVSRPKTQVVNDGVIMVFERKDDLEVILLDSGINKINSVVLEDPGHSRSYIGARELEDSSSNYFIPRVHRAKFDFYTNRYGVLNFLWDFKMEIISEIDLPGFFGGGTRIFNPVIEFNNLSIPLLFDARVYNLLYMSSFK